jgi:hypothetical protein
MGSVALERRVKSDSWYRFTSSVCLGNEEPMVGQMGLVLADGPAANAGVNSRLQISPGLKASCAETTIMGSEKILLFGLAILYTLAAQSRRMQRSTTPH